MAQARAPRLPDFLVIGAQKAGTTSLHRALQRQRRLFLPANKELHYFTAHSHQPLAWYAAHFARARAHQLCGEMTPYYLSHPAVPQRLAEHLPQVRLIVLLRDPVARTLSHYFHARRRGNESLALSTALTAESYRLEGAEALLLQPGASHWAHQTQSYLSRSRYELQLPRFDAWRQQGRLLVLRSEDLFGQPQQTLAEVLGFLGLPTGSASRLRLPKTNSGRGEAAAVPQEVRAALREQLAPTYHWAAKTFGLRWD